MIRPNMCFAFCASLVIMVFPCFAASEALAGSRANGLFARELSVQNIVTSGGFNTVIALPVVYSQAEARRRLIEGSHRSSLARDDLRQKRYEQALRRMIYQPDLPRSAFAVHAKSALRRLGVAEQSVEAAAAAFLVFPELIDGDYIFPDGADGAVSKVLKPVLDQLGSESSHLAKVVSVAPAVLQGASIVNDFLLYKALATDVAAYRMQEIKSHVIRSSRMHRMDPALLDAINVIERELNGMLRDASWRAIADTVRRNRRDLVGAGGKTILGSGLKMLGTSNPAMLVFGGTMWGVSRLADHIEAAHLAITTATIGWRIEAAANARDDIAASLIVYSKYAYADAMYDASSNALARLRDSMVARRSHAELREHYGSIRSSYRERLVR